ncbi:MAG TPA: hypothetical protein VF657_16725 [Actinoplanes sp.]|jgi:hypothetical protein
MSPIVALHIITWAAIILLFFGLAAVLREVRLLRGLVTRDAEGYSSSAPDLVLGEKFAGAEFPRIVLAADSGCPFCRVVVERIISRRIPVTLLTHEETAVWSGAGDNLTIVSDQESWRLVSHLAPPVLMLVDTTGSVRKLILPVREEEVDTILDDWSGMAGKGNHRVADIRAHS